MFSIDLRWLDNRLDNTILFILFYKIADVIIIQNNNITHNKNIKSKKLYNMPMCMYSKWLAYKLNIIICLNQPIGIRL